MSAVVPAPRPGDPLRRVVAREGGAGRTWTRNYTVDTLVCGHVVTDYDNREPERRRCRECGRVADCG